MLYRMNEEFMEAKHEIEREKLYAKLGVGNVATRADFQTLVNRQKEEVEQLQGFWGKRISDMART